MRVSESRWGVKWWYESIRFLSVSGPPITLIVAVVLVDSLVSNNNKYFLPRQPVPRGILDNDSNRDHVEYCAVLTSCIMSISGCQEDKAKLLMEPQLIFVSYLV
uniref:Uncharacterized protein n=1 Tax=Setaria digitata TaxID=48799 RepID=A0A915PVG8_9BILA